MAGWRGGGVAGWRGGGAAGRGCGVYQPMPRCGRPQPTSTTSVCPMAMTELERGSVRGRGAAARRKAAAGASASASARVMERRGMSLRGKRERREGLKFVRFVSGEAWISWIQEDRPSTVLPSASYWPLASLGLLRFVEFASVAGPACSEPSRSNAAWLVAGSPRALSQVATAGLLPEWLRVQQDPCTFALCSILEPLVLTSASLGDPVYRVPLLIEFCKFE